MTASTETPGPGQPIGDTVDELLVSGFQAKQSGLPEMALASFARATQEEPDDHEILVELAKCQVECALHEEALRTLRNIPADSVDDPEMHMELARTFRLAGDVDAALESFRNVKQNSGHYAQATLEIVMLMERQHQLEEAESFLNNRRGNPNQPTRQLAAAILAERTGDLEKATRCFRRAWRSKRGGCSIEAGYRLARLLDRREQPGEAMQILAACKKVEKAERTTMALQEFVLQRRAYDRTMLEKIPADWFDHAPQIRRGKSLLVLGHPRSGTSLCSKLLSKSDHTQWVDESPGFDVLAQHQIFQGYDPCERPEELLQVLTKIAADGQTDFPREYRQRLLASRRLPVTDPDTILIDKNPGLSTSLPALACLLPDAPWLMMLRDPRDIAISCYFQRFGATPLGVSCLSLKGALDAVAHMLFYWKTIRKMLPAARCMEIRYEQLVENSDQVLKQASHFLGLHTPGESVGEQKDAPLLESPTYADILKPVHRNAVDRWRQHQHALLPEQSAELSGLLDEFGYPGD